MKIVHFSHVPIPEDAVRQYHAMNTHPGRWALNHAIAQKRAGMDVEVVTIAHKASCDFIREIDGVRVHFLRTFYPYRHLTFYAVDQFRMARYAKKLSPEFRVAGEMFFHHRYSCWKSGGRQSNFSA